MRLSGRKTAPVFARYDIVSPNELRDAAAKLGARGADDTIRLLWFPACNPVRFMSGTIQFGHSHPPGTITCFLIGPKVLRNWLAGALYSCNRRIRGG